MHSEAPTVHCPGGDTRAFGQVRNSNSVKCRSVQISSSPCRIAKYIDQLSKVAQSMFGITLILTMEPGCSKPRPAGGGHRRSCRVRNSQPRMRQDWGTASARPRADCSVGCGGRIAGAQAADDLVQHRSEQPGQAPRGPVTERLQGTAPAREFSQPWRSVHDCSVRTWPAARSNS